jgi:hypothetical protein
VAVQAPHCPPEHDNPESQVSPAQHFSPLIPQPTQLLPLHTVSCAVHVPLQHTAPSVPQLPQPPFAQADPLLQRLPLATHVPTSQQLLLSPQPLLGQHG